METNYEEGSGEETNCTSENVALTSLSSICSLMLSNSNDLKRSKKKYSFKKTHRLGLRNRSMWGKKDCSSSFKELTSDIVEVVLLPVMQSLFFKADIVSALLISVVSNTVVFSVVVVVNVVGVVEAVGVVEVVVDVVIVVVKVVVVVVEVVVVEVVVVVVVVVVG